MPASTANRSMVSRLPSTPSPSSASSAGSRLASSRAASCPILACRPFCADTGSTCASGTSSSRAAPSRWRSICCTICAGVLSVSHSVSILLSTTKRVSWLSSPVIRCSRQIDRSERVTPVSAPRMKTTACACGIRLTVSSGSAPIAFRPGVSRITSPCSSSGCGMFSTAWRQRGISTRPSASCTGLSSGVSGFQKPSARASSLLTQRTSATLPMA
ncbi:hypothetical protein D9M68_480280 [compost metagenome]